MTVSVPRAVRACMIFLVSRSSASRLLAMPRTNRAGSTLIGDHELEAWRKPTGDWFVAGDARLDPKNPSRLAGVTGQGVLINGPEGRTTNLYTSREFGDLEAHLEFLIPRDRTRA